MRVKRGTKARKRLTRVHKKTEGFRGRSGNTRKQAIQRLEKGMTYAYRDRRVKKREFRSLWVVRINAAVREHGLSYSRFIAGLKKANVIIDRKMLAHFAAEDTAAFTALVGVAKGA